MPAISSAIKAPTQGAGAGPDLPPAGLVAQKYGTDLMRLGATSVQATGAEQLTVKFRDAWDSRYASETLKNAVDGVKVIYEWPAGQATVDLVSFPLEQAKFAARLGPVTGFTTGGRPENPKFPTEVTFRAANEADRSYLAGLLRDSFVGTGVRTSVIDDSLV